MVENKIHGWSIGFIVDQPGWAFDRSTKSLSKYLKNAGIDVKIYYRDSFSAPIPEDFIYVCWWPDVEIIKQRITEEQKILCKIADVLTWNHRAPQEWQDKFKNIIPHVDYFIATSKEIVDYLKSMGVYNSTVVEDGVDIYDFPEKKYNINKIPVVGWCGNPYALEWLGVRDVKGISVLSCLNNFEGIRFVRAINKPMDEMPSWYQNIDIYVCASRYEGTPIPVLEAMAVGDIIISTNVGIVREINSAGIFRFNGTTDGLINTLHKVLHMREKWRYLGHLNRQTIEKRYTSEISAKKLISIMGGI